MQLKEFITNKWNVKQELQTIIVFFFMEEIYYKIIAV